MQALFIVHANMLTHDQTHSNPYPHILTKMIHTCIPYLTHVLTCSEPSSSSMSCVHAHKSVLSTQVIEENQWSLIKGRMHATMSIGKAQDPPSGQAPWSHFQVHFTKIKYIPALHWSQCANVSMSMVRAEGQRNIHNKAHNNNSFM